MKCEKCNVEMIEGSLVHEGRVWTKLVSHFKLPKINVPWPTGVTCTAWRCPNCGEVKLIAK